MVNESDGQQHEIVALMESFFEETAQTVLREAGATLGSISTQDLMGVGWRALGLSVESEWQIDHSIVQAYVRKARLASLLSPVIRCVIGVEQYYTFGQGVSITARDERVQEVINDYLRLKVNRKAVTGFKARMKNAGALKRDGAVYLRFFTDRRLGMVQARTVEPLEVIDLVTNPEDREDVWFVVCQKLKGVVAYPATTFAPDSRLKLDAFRLLNKNYANISVAWDTPVLVRTVNEVGRWGLPEILASLTWAKVYEQFLENRATLYAAFAALALLVKEKSDRVAKVKRALAAKADTKNPAAVGSTAVTSTDGSIEPINTRAATTPPSEGIQFLEMVAMDQNVPIHLFGKDQPSAGIGSDKRQNSLFFLMIGARRREWQDAIRDEIEYVLMESVRYGKLRGAGTIVRVGSEEFVEWSIDGVVDIEFPPLQEADVKEMIDGVISLVTLDGKTPSGIVTPRDFLRMIEPYVKLDNFAEIVAAAPEEWPTNDTDAQAMVEQLKAVAGEVSTEGVEDTGEEGEAENE